MSGLTYKQKGEILMTYQFAKQLHNGDEVTIKETQEVVVVISTIVQEKDVFIEAMTSEGFRQLHHQEIS